MTGRMAPDDDVVDFDALLGDAAAVAVGIQQSGPFLAWLRENLPRYASPGSQLGHDLELQRAFASAFGRQLWNAMPLPRRGFLAEPIAEPGRNDPCPCGSGRKYKHCCAQAPSLAALDARTLWPYVLRALSEPLRSEALRSPHLPREAVLQHAADEIEAGRADAAVRLLEPMFDDPIRREDDLAAWGLDLLCDAYDARGRAKRRKRALLQRAASRPQRSALRSAAHQRLACIHMDEGQPEQSWKAFRHAQQDDPGNPALGALEVQLLIGEGRQDHARERAQFFLAQMRRRGEDLDPKTLRFYEALAADPGRALSDVLIEMEQGAGRRLADWLDRVGTRPLPAYRVVPVGGAAAAEADGTSPGHILSGPSGLAALEARWRKVFPLGKPFSIHPLPFGGGDAWEATAENDWMTLLERHPEAFDSIDLLDDLATAAMMHPDADHSSLRDRLLRPLLMRTVAILERALAAGPPGHGAVRLRWLVGENRPVLRALFRLHEGAVIAGRDEEARRLAERLLELNPDDNHGTRYWLANTLLEAGDAAACLRIVEAYPDDAAPEMGFNAALAHFQLGHGRSATESLLAADRATPRVRHYLLARRVSRPKLHEHGVTLGGDDRGWLYRENMRSTWVATPGALEWAAKILSHSGR